MELLEFERPIVELQRELAALDGESGQQADKARAKLRRRLDKLEREVYGSLDAWQVVRIARHPDRPQLLDYLPRLFDDFVELHGDRLYGDDRAVIGGLARLGDRRVVLVGQHKGRDAAARRHHNFGMGQPEGYRKAVRLFALAERFELPVVTLIDTPGAFPGIESERRGIATAIADSLLRLAELAVPLVAVIIGEGGSGGALGLALADRVLMLQYAYYAVITPEACASILWKDQDEARDMVAEAARNLHLTAPQLLELGLIDGIVEEAVGGAHHDLQHTATILKGALRQALDQVDGQPADQRRQARWSKFRAMGVFEED